MSSSDASAASPSHRPTLTMVTSIAVIGATGLLCAVVVGLLGMRSQSSFDNNLDRINSIRVGAIVSSGMGQNGTAITAAQARTSWAVHRDGAAATVDSAPARAAYLASVATLKQTMGRMPLDQLSQAEKALYQQIQGFWDQYFALNEQAWSLYQKGDRPGGDQLVLTQAPELFGKAAASTTDLNAAINKRVAEINTASHDAVKRYRIAQFALLGLTVALTLGLTWMVVRRFRRDINDMNQTLAAVAQGDLTRDPQYSRADELGTMSRSLLNALESLRALVTGVDQVSISLSSASDELNSVSSEVAQNSTNTSEQIDHVSLNTEEMSRNVQTVAAGTEEMSASIREISASAQDAVAVAQRAVQVADTTNATVAQLGDSSAEIGSVVKVITSIAEQTNLLALNATIEAARAGDAGKGFAVVANEVKELAQETAKATGDISSRVEQIQVDIQASISAIAEISAIISRINDTQTTIASAVEQQTATTNEMSRSVAQAASGAGLIAENIATVAQMARSSTDAAHHTAAAATQLRDKSGNLRDLVSQYHV